MANALDVVFEHSPHFGPARLAQHQQAYLHLRLGTRL
jgi:hypothetical protein